jgi:hypothetical protein
LVQQWLKEMKVAAVDQCNLNRSAAELARGVKTSEAATNDDDAVDGCVRS